MTKSIEHREMSFIFGPVSSRRLGVSLGIDVVPRKWCTFDCIYCEVGPTTHKSATVQHLVDTGQILAQIAQVLKKPGLKLDFITLAGSGEPTLNSDLGAIVSGIRKLTDTPVALLTNGSLFFREDVRRAVRDIDLIIPSLDCVDEAAFQTVNRPHPSLTPAAIIQGLKELRRDFDGKIWLEILLVKDFNDQSHHINKLVTAVRDIRPDRIQLNTVVRPPAYSAAKPVSLQDLEAILARLGDRTEIIASFSGQQKQGPAERTEVHIINLLRRRPCPLDEISRSTGLEIERLVAILDRLTDEHRIRYDVHNGIGFYQAA